LSANAAGAHVVEAA
jgi:hypothetical protein